MWMEEQALRCPGCGIPRDQVWPAGPKEAREMIGKYEGVSVKCMACSAASEAQTRFHTQPHDEHGIHFIIKDHDLEYEDDG